MLVQEPLSNFLRWPLYGKRVCLLVAYLSLHRTVPCHQLSIKTYYHKSFQEYKHATKQKLRDSAVRASKRFCVIKRGQSTTDIPVL